MSDTEDISDPQFEDELVDTNGRRLRTLTLRGQELYESTSQYWRDKLKSTWDKINSIVLELNVKPDSIEVLNRHEKNLVSIFQKLESDQQQYIDFLLRTNTNDSLQELAKQQEMSSDYKNAMSANIERINNFKKEFEETKTIKSSNSKATKRSETMNSRASNGSSAVQRALAKAEAAKAKIKYAEEETRLKKEQARLIEEEAKSTRRKKELKADLELLAHKKEAAAAEAELEALTNGGSEGSRRSVLSQIEKIDVKERTKQYVEQQQQFQRNSNLNEQPTTDTVGPVQHVTSNVNQTATYTQPDAVQRNDAVVGTGLDVNASLFQPSFNNIQSTNDQQHFHALSRDFTKFLMKKDMLLSRLVSYNDRPETYAVWKSSFKIIMQELDASPNEELDLLVKWLGVESRKHALSIRSANFSNPKRGLQRVWERLDERYGCPEMVESTLKSKLMNFPRLTNKDNKRLYELSDILSEIESVKCDSTYSALLAYFDTSSGILPIVNKLPHNIQEKWTTHAVNYKKKWNVTFPPFSVFVEFIRDISKVKNDPSFTYEQAMPSSRTEVNSHSSHRSQTKTFIATKKTQANHEKCPLHKTNHSLQECKAFREKSLEERRKILKENKLCYRCCKPSHLRSECKELIKCSDCSSDSHTTPMHVSIRKPKEQTPSKTSIENGGEHVKSQNDQSERVGSICTQICGNEFSGKSCSKTLLVKAYPTGHPEKAVKMYAIHDDQSNRSLARSDFFDTFNLHSEALEYTLSSCSGSVVASGRRAVGFTIESIDGQTTMDLPTLIECDHIPDIKEEIATPAVAENYSHLKDIASYIPPFDEEASIMLLIGRDVVEAHHVHDQRIGPRRTPYAQRLKMGWVIVGETCLGKVHAPDVVNCNKTHLQRENRASLFKPCPNNLKIKETMNNDYNDSTLLKEILGKANVFNTTVDDNKVGLSVEDREFLDIMDREFYKDTDGRFGAPLPFRQPRNKMPNNRSQALKRARSLEMSLKKDPQKKQHFFEFMDKLIVKGHAEVAPELSIDEECWYLPIFGVYHPKKKDQIRVVFDSSAKHNDVSLNSVLLSGPDLVNSLLGVLLRFRKEPVAITADIEQMFYCFKVRPDHRNFLRFFWYKDNDFDKEIIEYRMCVHVFGNSPSPAVATYGLRKSAKVSSEIYGSDVEEFINSNFYVDDGLTSLPTSGEAISLMQRTKKALLSEGNLHLHKIASNKEEVRKAFNVADLAKDLKELDTSKDNIPLQRSLGLTWDLISDTFTFRVSTDEKPFTRRGILSTINSLFDPLGFVAPVTIEGKVILRNLMNHTKEWDEPLPEKYREQWNKWRRSLDELRNLQIPRTYSSTSFASASQRQLHIYSDASEKAIASVAYLCTQSEGIYDIGFVMGKAKVAPTHGTTIPRLELCAAVMATEIAETICDQLNMQMENVRFYTDSKVVLGYIFNRTRRFYTYVSNRVQKIRKLCEPEQWNYVPTDKNPADVASRGSPASNISSSMWLKGPANLSLSKKSENYELVHVENDKELRPEINTMKTILEQKPTSSRFEKFSQWVGLLRSIVTLKRFIKDFKARKGSESSNKNSNPLDDYTEAEALVIKTTQKEIYMKEIEDLKRNKPLSKTSKIASLNPFVDRSGILRVGGRLNQADITSKEKHPAIIPGTHHIATLLVRHFHQKIKHQGRHFTAGEIRTAGFWITGSKRLISSIIFKCVKCRKLRGSQQHQMMANLPEDRVSVVPPFTYVGVDTFGPWTIISRKTRGGQANSQRWAIMFTCLTVRAVHIELVDELSSSAFINALRRLVSIRGPVKEFRSDRGTNFVGATDNLGIHAINVEDDRVKNFLTDAKTVWKFNPPHASHMGGVWERMIGVARKILNSILSEMTQRYLTHDVLSTFMYEVSAIMNSRPIVEVSNEPEQPEVLSPSMLLTQKTDLVEVELCSDDIKNLYSAQWKRVQLLANLFWKKWRNEYLQSLQPRRKWKDSQPNLSEGDVVLMRDTQAHRNEWPVGLVTKTFKGEDDRVRTVNVKIIRKGANPTTYVRPIHELVLLVKRD